MPGPGDLQLLAHVRSCSIFLLFLFEMQANFIVEFVLVRNDIPKKNVWISILSEIVGKKTFPVCCRRKYRQHRTKVQPRKK